MSKNSDYKISRNYPKLLEWSITKIKINFGVLYGTLLKSKEKKRKVLLFKTVYTKQILIRFKAQFAENLLSKDDNTKAITFISENSYREQITWHDLNLNVNKIANYFKYIKVKK